MSSGQTGQAKSPDQSPGKSTELATFLSGTLPRPPTSAIDDNQSNREFSMNSRWKPEQHSSLLVTNIFANAEGLARLQMQELDRKYDTQVPLDEMWKLSMRYWKATRAIEHLEQTLTALEKPITADHGPETGSNGDVLREASERDFMNYMNFTYGHSPNYHRRMLLNEDTAALLRGQGDRPLITRAPPSTPALGANEQSGGSDDKDGPVGTSSNDQGMELESSACLSDTCRESIPMILVLSPSGRVATPLGSSIPIPTSSEEVDVQNEPDTDFPLPPTMLDAEKKPFENGFIPELQLPSPIEDIIKSEPLAINGGSISVGNESITDFQLPSPVEDTLQHDSPAMENESAAVEDPSVQESRLPYPIEEGFQWVPLVRQNESEAHENESTTNFQEPHSLLDDPITELPPTFGEFRRRGTVYEPGNSPYANHNLSRFPHESEPFMSSYLRFLDCVAELYEQLDEWEDRVNDTFNPRISHERNLASYELNRMEQITRDFVVAARSLSGRRP